MKLDVAFQDKVAWRWAVLRHARCFTLGERLACVTPKMGQSVRGLLHKRLRTAADGTPYFLIGDDRIHFVPDDAAANREALIDGALTILEEAYARPSEFFSSPVVIRPGDTVLDLGGNFGTSALTFARCTGPGGRVFSFEPAFAEPLRRTLADNGVGNATVIPDAVGDTPGEMDFYVSDAGIDSRLSNEPRGGVHRRVRVVTLDAFVESAGLDRVDFIKVDIEGAEELAIRGATGVIERFRPKWSVSSYHTDLQGDRQHPKLVRLLRSLGYTTREVRGRHIYAW